MGSSESPNRVRSILHTRETQPPQPAASGRHESRRVVQHPDPLAPQLGRRVGASVDQQHHILLDLHAAPRPAIESPDNAQAWVDAYKQAAPRIQRVLDSTADNVKEWGPKANDIDCTQDIEGQACRGS